MKINSIVMKMMIPLFAVTVLIITMTLLLTQTFLKQVIEDTFVNTKVDHFQHSNTLKIDNILSNIIKDSIAIASSYDITTFMQSRLSQEKKVPKKTLRQIQKLKQLYKLDTIYIVDTESKYYFSEKGFIKVVKSVDHENTRFLKTLHTKQRFFLNGDCNINGKLYICANALIGTLKHPIGFAGGGIDVNSVLKTVLEEFNQSDTNAFILDHENRILTSLPSVNFSNEKQEALHKALYKGNTLIKYHFQDKIRYLLFSKIDKLGWTIVIDFSKEKLLDTFHGICDEIIMGGTILLFLFMIIASWFFTYLISKPLKEISHALETFDFTSDFKPIQCTKMGYEIEMICNAFNHSSKILREMLHKHKNSEELLRSIINATDDLIFFKDTKNRYLGCNKAYEKWNAKSMDDIIGKTDMDLYSYDITNTYMRIDNQTISTNKTIMSEKEFQKSNGDIITLQVKKSPFKNNDGRIQGTVVVARDITLIKKMEKNLRTLNTILEKREKEKTYELEIANERLEEHIFGLEVLNFKLTKTKEQALQAAQARSNFISSISHELRTPLNAIINFTDQVIEDFEDMLNDHELQDDSKIYLNRVMVNSKHLLQLINDLLEFTKAEAGKIEYSIELIDINEVLQTAYNNTSSLLKDTQVNYSIETYDKPLMAFVDARRFLQVLLNLLSNAIKFTQDGFVKIRAFPKENSIIVEIEDSGKGIPIEKQKSIFDPFVQVDNTDYGTGLGLGLVKRMCDDMKVNIILFSEVSKGTTFRLVLQIPHN